MLRFSTFLLRSSAIALRGRIRHISTVHRFGFPQKDVQVCRRLLPFPFLTLGALQVKCQCDKPKKSCSDEGVPEPLGFNSTSPPPPTPRSCSQPFEIEELPECDDDEEPVRPADPFAAIFGIAASAQSKAEPEELTHKFLLKQACTVSIDSVTRVLTETMSTIEDYHQMYRQQLAELMELLEESRTAAERRQELITCKMIVLRSQMDDMRSNITEVESYLGSVHRLCHAAAETAFLAHAEYPSVALSERVQSALIEAKRIKDITTELERDLIQLQSIVIVECGNSLK